MSSLTPQQERICSFVGSYRERNRISPTYSEIGEFLGVTKQAVQYQVKSLVQAGYLQKPRDVRSLMTTDVWLRHRLHRLDRETNPMVPVIAEESPQLFEEFTDSDWETLYSCRGVGGALTGEGIVSIAQRINENRTYRQRAAELLENGGTRQELMNIIDRLWDQVSLSSGKNRNSSFPKGIRPNSNRIKTRTEQSDDTGRDCTRD